MEISIKGKKIKNCSLPKGTTKDTINEKLALFYSQLPYKIGKDGEGNDITLNIGRFGPYLFHNKKFYSIKTKPLHEITLEECLGMLK